MFKVASSFIVAALIAAGLIITNAPVRAQDVPPCDFITGGGFVLRTPSGPKANFGAHGGCKHGEFWGHVNYVDHGGSMGKTPYHVDSIDITAYLFVNATTRDICGSARTNAGEMVQFHVRMVDGANGSPDRFGIRLSNEYVQSTSALGGGGPGGGNIELHKPNPPASGVCSVDPPPDDVIGPDAP
jgi:hypothetical protein